jgi:hypothetical protein
LLFVLKRCKDELQRESAQRGFPRICTGKTPYFQIEVDLNTFKCFVLVQYDFLGTIMLNPLHKASNSLLLLWKQFRVAILGKFSCNSGKKKVKANKNLPITVRCGGLIFQDWKGLFQPTSFFKISDYS